MSSEGAPRAEPPPMTYREHRAPLGVMGVVIFGLRCRLLMGNEVFFRLRTAYP